MVVVASWSGAAWLLLVLGSCGSLRETCGFQHVLWHSEAEDDALPSETVPNIMKIQLCHRRNELHFKMYYNRKQSLLQSSVLHDPSFLNILLLFVLFHLIYLFICSKKLQLSYIFTMIYSKHSLMSFSVRIVNITIFCQEYLELLLDYYLELLLDESKRLYLRITVQTQNVK